MCVSFSLRACPCVLGVGAVLALGTAEITAEPSGGGVSLIKSNICDGRITPVSYDSAHKFKHVTLRLCLE